MKQRERHLGSRRRLVCGPTWPPVLCCWRQRGSPLSGPCSTVVWGRRRQGSDSALPSLTWPIRPEGMSKHEFRSANPSFIVRVARKRTGDTSCCPCFREHVLKFATELEARTTRHLSSLLAKVNLAPHSNGQTTSRSPDDARQHAPAWRAAVASMRPAITRRSSTRAGRGHRECVFAHG